MYLILSILNCYFKKLKHEITERVICWLPPSAFNHPLSAYRLLIPAFCVLPSAFFYLLLATCYLLFVYLSTHRKE
jgi:hypothetical protein